MKLAVNLADANYEIVIERGALAAAVDFAAGRKTLIVTDSGVPAQYAAAVAARCDAAFPVVVPQGESSKSFTQLERLLQVMLDAAFDRGDCVAAVGGGVVGDLAGLAAALYMRGIDFYNLPTTLLSQVDSSVGGKTAVDFAGVKNAVGVFYQPRRVIIDPDTLATLPPRQLAAGMAEVIKIGATLDAGLFALTETLPPDADLSELIARAVADKRDIVERDPRESGLRRVLNFGHTLGHAIESAAGGRLLHGECVALGMPPMCAGAARQRLQAVLKKYGLPLRTSVDPAAVAALLRHDKKSRGGLIRAVVAPEIGSYEFCDLTAEELMRRMEECL